MLKKYWFAWNVLILRFAHFSFFRFGSTRLINFQLKTRSFEQLFKLFKTRIFSKVSTRNLKIFCSSIPVFTTYNFWIILYTCNPQIFNNSPVRLSTRNLLFKFSTRISQIFCNLRGKLSTRNLLLKFSTRNWQIFGNTWPTFTTFNS